jgi:regulator of PEP synthase PpsR (kinase-PPPase family)
MKRAAFIISDGTGITAESLSNSLLSQFEELEIEKEVIPYVTLEKMREISLRIDAIYQQTAVKPLVFMTLVNPEIAALIHSSRACVFDLFNTFLAPLEETLGMKSTFQVGLTHGRADTTAYDLRIEAVNYTLEHDDGIKLNGYHKADVILIGVSRSGKTPSCLYMALQCGLFAANYPLTDDEASYSKLPESLRPHKHKLFGLTIDPERLQQIRQARCPNSQYASRTQCLQETSDVETLFKCEKIPFINSTHYSIEEIVTRVIDIAKLKRRV